MALVSLTLVLSLLRMVATTPCRQPSAPDCFEPSVTVESGCNSLSCDGWDDYKTQMGKSYESEEEEGKRRQIWWDNTLLIMQENMNESHTYSLGWTPFTDMTEDEFSVRLGYKPSASTRTSSSYLGEFNFSGDLTGLPSDFDWTLAGQSSSGISVVTRVKNQGQCGSCWSFSVTGALEGAHAVANGIDAGKISMSESQLVDCDKQEGGCQGGAPSRAMDWEKVQNVCQEQSYPYHAARGTCKAGGCTVILNQGSIWGHYSVKADENDHCAALVQRPLSVVVDAPGAFENYRGGILNNCPQGQTDHAILLVGYGYYNGKAYWKVKNSWGTSWGLDGFALLARGVGGRGSCSILSGTHGVVVYGPFNPSTSIRGLDGQLIEDQSQRSTSSASISI